MTHERTLDTREHPHYSKGAAPRCGAQPAHPISDQFPALAAAASGPSRLGRGHKQGEGMTQLNIAIGRTGGGHTQSRRS